MDEGMKVTPKAEVQDKGKRAVIRLARPVQRLHFFGKLRMSAERRNYGPKDLEKISFHKVQKA